MVRTRTAELSAQVARLSCDVHADTTTSCHCRDGSWFAKSCTRFGSMAGGGFINLFSTTKKLSLRLSVCPSVCPSCSLQQRAAGLLLRARRVGDIDRLLHGRRHSSTARAVSRLQLTYEAEEHRRVNFIVL